MHYLEAIKYDLAPRLAEGLRAAVRLLSDDEWHPSAELQAAVERTGLAPRTAENLLREMRRNGLVHTGADPADSRRRVYRLDRSATIPGT